MNASSALTFAYDDAGQIVSETQDVNAPVNLPAKTVEYTYDADGSRAALTYPSGTVLFQRESGGFRLMFSDGCLSTSSACFSRRAD